MDTQEIMGWNFPDNNYGQVVGISDAGIETFNGSLNASLTREICQNSIDASVDSSGLPVRIEFSATQIAKENIPGYEQLLSTMESCYLFWKDLDNEKTYHFFANAIKCLKNDFVNVLMISDYNTTGLLGSEKELNTPWQNLVKGNGISDKNETSGGSFGIGKSAPFACSKLRTVFYRTLDINTIRATQGISRLVSHRVEKDKIAAGTGYYGNVNKNLAIECIDTLDKIKMRTSSGTDIFVIGYDNLEEWEEQIICELLEGFLLPILQGTLEVVIGDTFINAESLSRIMDYYKDKVKNAYNYYLVMTSEKTKTIEEDFHGMGTIYLKVLLDDDLNRNVMITRASGMKLFSKNRISRTIQFSSVLLMKGKELNAFFRKMESPQHNAWETDRYKEDPKLARQMRDELFAWVKRKVYELGEYQSGDELDAEGIGDLIPDFFDFDNAGTKKEEEAISNVIKEPWEVKVSEKPESLVSISKQIEMETKERYEDVGMLDEEGEFPTKDVPHGEFNSTDGGEGAPALGNSGEGNRPIEKYKEISTYRMRMFVSDTTETAYTLTFITDCDVNAGYIEVFISGEQSSIVPKIMIAKKVDSGIEELNTQGNHIKVSSIKKGIRNRIVFKLEEDELYTLEVKLYAGAI